MPNEMMDSKRELYFTSSIIDKVSSEIKNTILAHSPDRSALLQMDSSALLIVDMQKYFFSPDSHAFIPSAPSIISKVKDLIEYYKEHSLPIILTKHIEDSGINMGKWWRRKMDDASSAFISEISEISEMDTPLMHIIHKSTYDPFYNTDLEKILRAGDVTQLVICGVMTNLCVEQSARSAFVRDILPVIPIDTTAAYTRKLHESTLKNASFAFGLTPLSKELL